MEPTNPETPQAPAQETTEAPKPEAPKNEPDWKAEARKWEQRAKENTAAAKKLAELEAAQATEQEKAVKAAVDEAVKAERQRSNSVLISAEARALAAAAKFRDPSDAVKFLDLGEVAVNDAGEVDKGAIQKALADLAESKPYLLADDSPPPPPPMHGGPRTPAQPDKPATLTEAIERRVAQNIKPR